MSWNLGTTALALLLGVLEVELSSDFKVARPPTEKQRTLQRYGRQPRTRLGRHVFQSTSGRMALPAKQLALRPSVVARLFCFLGLSAAPGPEPTASTLACCLWRQGVAAQLSEITHQLHRLMLSLLGLERVHLEQAPSP